MDMDFDCKRVLMTGGTKGMGRAIVSKLQEANASVLTTARSKPIDQDASIHFVADDISTAKGC